VLFAHDRHDVLGGHHRAAQVDGANPVEHCLGDFRERRIAAADAHPDVIVQNVDAPPAPPRLGDGRGERAFLGDVRLECRAGAAVLGRQSRGFFRRGEVAVDREHLRALLTEPQHGRAAVAQALAGALAGSDHDRNFSRKTHGELLVCLAIAQSDFDCHRLGLTYGRAPASTRGNRHLRSRGVHGRIS